MGSRGTKQSDYAARSARAQKAGFRNYSHYRKETSKPGVQRILARTGVKDGRSRYTIAALASGVATLPGAPGEKARVKKAGIISDAIKRAGKRPSGFWKALGSPKKPKMIGSHKR